MKVAQWPADLKRTRPREVVWRILSESERPLDVKEIYRRTEGAREALAVSTVYRVLSAFESHGLVTKTTMMGEETALYRLRRAEHEHYAVCLRCHRQVPLQCCPFESIPLHAEPEGFDVTGHRLELYGYCRECRKQEQAACPRSVDDERRGGTDG